MAKRNLNWFIISSSIVGILCLVLSYFIHWSFSLITLISVIVNQRELMENSK